MKAINRALAYSDVILGSVLVVFSAIMLFIYDNVAFALGLLAISILCWGTIGYSLIRYQRAEHHKDTLRRIQERKEQFK